jgi:hypothetical protein
MPRLFFYSSCVIIVIHKVRKAVLVFLCVPLTLIDINVEWGYKIYIATQRGVKIHLFYGKLLEKPIVIGPILLYRVVNRVHVRCS